MARNDHNHLPMYAFTESAPRLRLSEKATHLSPITTLPSYFSASRRHRFNPWYALRIRPRRILAILKVALPLAIILLLGALLFWEPHIELAFYSRDWIRHEIKPIEPLAGCFDSTRVSQRYNVSELVYGYKRTEVQAGMSLKMGMDCYDFAGTIQTDTQFTDLSKDRVNFHTYWRKDLATFSERQEWLLKSFFSTQDLRRTKLIMWSNGDLRGNRVLMKWIRRFPDSFELRVADVPQLSRGTELEGSHLLKITDEKAWVDGDLIRLLVLWAFGGVWVDMDSLLTRDMSPLFEHEFVTQWDCYEKAYQPLNGALMHFRQHSPYLCEAFHVMQTSKPPRTGSTDWGSILYQKVWRRLVAAHIPPFKVLPFCFSDARSCRLDNRLPDPFVTDRADGQWTMGLGLEEGGGLDRALQNVFAVHLHNQWEKFYPAGGWVERLLLNRFQKRLDDMEIRIK